MKRQSFINIYQKLEAKCPKESGISWIDFFQFLQLTATVTNKPAWSFSEQRLAWWVAVGG